MIAPKAKSASTSFVSPFSLNDTEQAAETKS